MKRSEPFEEIIEMDLKRSTRFFDVADHDDICCKYDAVVVAAGGVVTAGGGDALAQSTLVGGVVVPKS